MAEYEARGPFPEHLTSGFTLQPPASVEAIAAAQEQLGWPLPPDYAAFIRNQNGGEGWIEEFYLMLYSLESLLRLQNPWGEHPNHWVIFGSDGGGELFAFDTGRDMAVFVIPAVGGPQHAIFCAPTFTELLRRLHAGWNPLAP